MSIPDRLFENIVQDLTVDEAAYAYEMSHTQPPSRTYVVMFMARSGSSWLTSLLSGTDALGHPEEYINPNFIRDVANALNSRDQAGFLDMLQRRRKTPNGIFGIEVRAFDIDHFGPEVFFRTFGYETLYFNLWRENLILQAISLYRAITTGRWHSYEAAEGAKAAVYDAAEIERLTVQLLNDENDNVLMLRRHSRRARSICYETMVSNRDGTLKLFADALGVRLDATHYAPPKQGEHSKIGDGWNEEAEQRFRRERPDFIARLEAQRLIRQQ